MKRKYLINKSYLAAKRLLPARIKIIIKQLIKATLPPCVRNWLKWHLLFKPIMKKTSPSFHGQKNLPQGINLIGTIRSGKGTGVHTRLIAQALSAVGIPFCVIDLTKHFDLPLCNFDHERKISDKQIYNINLITLEAASIEHALLALDREETGKRFNIAYWAWELPYFPDIWQPVFAHFQEVWANSQFSAASIAKKSPVPTLGVPLYADSLNSVIDNGRAYFNIPQNLFLFMVAYDCDSFVTRKNPQAAVHAFMKAFSPEDRHVGLVLKLHSSENYQEHINELFGNLAAYQNVYYVDKYLSDEEMRTLISLSDVFVSLHRAEGFGLIPLEAFALGTPVISTAWSGNMEYMNHKNAALVGYTLVTVNGQYIATAMGESYVWADPDIEEAADHMRRLVSDREWREELISNAKETVETSFNAQVMGNTIRERLQILNLLNIK